MSDNRRKYDMDKPHRFTRFVVYGALVSLFLTLLTFAFWQFYPYNVIKQTPTPWKIVEIGKTARQGGALSYEYDYTKYIDVPVDVTKQFRDGLIFEAVSPTTHKSVGSGHVHAEFQIPMTLPPGKYTLRITAIHHINPIRDITIISDTETFTVLPSVDHPDETLDEIPSHS
jgi:hypothetical protein